MLIVYSFLFSEPKKNKRIRKFQIGVIILV